MTRITFALATVLSLAFTPLAAQETNCDGWMASDWDVTKQFWEAVTLETVADCLNSGADVNARDERRVTSLLFAAAFSDNPDVLTMLLDAGADVNIRAEDEYTPLHGAAENNENPEIITILLDAGADGTAVDGDGNTPFDLAKDNEALVGTDAYWALNDARFE